MKAVLFLEMPEDCGKCVLCEADESFWGDVYKARCGFTGENIIFNLGVDRNNKCPLKERYESNTNT